MRVGHVRGAALPCCMTGNSLLSVASPPLPLRVRLLDRLVDALVLADGLRRELHTEEANGVLWIDPYLEHVYRDLDSLVQRLAD
jgi:hypothetical protein